MVQHGNFPIFLPEDLNDAPQVEDKEHHNARLHFPQASKNDKQYDISPHDLFRHSPVKTEKQGNTLRRMVSIFTYHIAALAQHLTMLYAPLDIH